MKVLLLFNGIYPEGMAMSKRLHLYCKCLHAKSLQPHIFFPSKGRILAKGYHEGVKYSSFKNPVKFKHIPFRQINCFFAAFWYAYQTYKYSKNYSMFFVSGFGWFTLQLMITGIHLGKRKVILEINENPYTPEGGRLDPIWIRKFRRMLMLNFTFKFVDGFIVISRALEVIVNKYKKTNSILIRVPILIDDNYLIADIIENRKCPFILHAGALSETKDGMVEVFEAFAKACSKSYRPLYFILTINTMSPKLKKKIQSIIEKNHLMQRVIFKGHLSQDELDKLRASSSMAIVNKPSNWQNEYNFPTKLGELLAAGVPVIASKTGEMVYYLIDNETAFLVNANDSNEIADRILFILNNPETVKKVVINGQKLAKEKFYYLNYTESIVDFFKQVAK